MDLGLNLSDAKKAGYGHLLEKLSLSFITHWHQSYVSTVAVHHSWVQNEVNIDIYSPAYWPGDSVGDHLEFALKYDGVNLNYLAAIFGALPEADILDYIQSKPKGKYARRIWFFYEALMKKELPISSLTNCNYTEALEPEKYFTINDGTKSPRHRIVNNMLGGKRFCPIVRRTAKLQEIESTDLKDSCEKIVANYPPELLRRALSYLYSKETKSSFEIEHVKPNASRTEKFIALLELAERQDFCNKESLIDLQNKIVDPRFKDENYRASQNYVGQTISFQKEIIHYISPKPEDLSSLMSGLLSSHQQMKEGSVAPIIHAAITSYGFVFLHPFEDGNGRIHRFLIHNILSILGVVPKGLMFPVSAVMLKNLDAYNNSLEAFSKPLMQFIEYQLSESGILTVKNDTGACYRYMDMTIQAEALYDFVNQTIETELAEELNFLVRYDKTKKGIQSIVDMPDRLIDLFIQLCLQNNGRLSLNKRDSHFNMLTNEELSSIEKVFRENYQSEIK